MHGIVSSLSCFDEFVFVLLYFIECQRNTYKANIGNDPCLPCPSNSVSVPQAVRCYCKKGFHRYRYSEDKDVCHGKEYIYIYIYMQFKKHFKYLN